MADKKDPNKGNTSEDDALWTLAMGDVRPLKGKAKSSTSSGSSKKPRGARETVHAPQKKETGARKGGGLDRRTAERLKKGKMDIEARIDLHGCTLAKAEEILIKSLTKCYREGKRCALVITGKGQSRTDKSEKDWWEGKAGAIRKSTPDWLARKPLSDIVLSHETARQHDGGAGALYVLLRRKR